MVRDPAHISLTSLRPFHVGMTTRDTLAWDLPSADRNVLLHWPPWEGMGMYKANGRWADNAAGLVKTAKLKGKLKADASPSMLSLSNASEEIAKALRIRQDAASAALYGLCAIGRVRWVDGKIVRLPPVEGVPVDGLER